ncbi:thioesterase family protein [Blastochloris sulfoviridis]|uniref:Thioesterase n=1 Tax=Blastochloris sulfoviridis TaxID=50712 RepID=A0A5M6HGU4_9HYPH|nr:thioesterase family protein [Blastochloris sulfoviridis]KAA5595084.1 thioesterase [Blastochloris sulfoviridis]
MLDRVDFVPVFFAPFVSAPMVVDPGWVDYNDHLNMAYYNVLFDRAMDEAMLLVGLGPYYVRHKGASYVTAEVHVRYMRELKADDPVRVTVQLLDFDDKRVHVFQQLYHAAEGWVSATSEQMALHVDLMRKKTAHFPTDILSRLALMKQAHDRLTPPEGAGRRIAMPPRPA